MMAKKNHLFSTVAPGLAPRRPRRLKQRKNASSKVHKVMRKEPSIGRLDKRDARVLSGMVTYARRAGVVVAKGRARADKAEAAAHQMQRRELAIQKKLGAQVKACLGSR